MPRIDQVPKALRYLSIRVQPANEEQVDDLMLELLVARQWLMLTADTIEVVEISVNTPRRIPSWWKVRKYEECVGLDSLGPARWQIKKMILQMTRDEAMTLREKYTYVLPLISSRFSKGD